MNKALRIDVVDPSFIPDGYDHPRIRIYECEHILKSCENESMNDVEKAINTLINHFVTKNLHTMIIDIDKRNKALAPAKEMTITILRKNLVIRLRL